MECVCLNSISPDCDVHGIFKGCYYVLSGKKLGFMEVFDILEKKKPSHIAVYDRNNFFLGSIEMKIIKKTLYYNIFINIDRQSIIEKSLLEMAGELAAKHGLYLYNGS